MTAQEQPLADEAARRIVTRELDRTLFVEAGAGSGKTSSLVARVVNLVVAGVQVSQIAAITFTEAAARELRTRVRDELERRAVDASLPHLLDAAAQVETASFTTLHGFALRLLSDHPVEAGLPPGFGVIDEIGSILDFQKAWRLFAGQIGDDLELLELQERASILNTELRRFVDVARRFDDNWDLIARVERQPPALSALDIEPVLTQVVGLGALVGHCLDERDRLAEGLLELVAAAEAIRPLDPLGQLEQLGRLPWPRRNGGRKGNWTTLSIDEARAAVEEIRTAVSELVEGYTREVIDHMVALVAGFVEARVASRVEAGELAFHDLLVLARRLLRGRPEVRQQLHNRYRRVLLDEFQDTDPIQIELAVLLSAEGEVGERPWQDLAVELPPGRLVVVGDPKQSIYRFRRADIKVYSQSEQALTGEPTRLTTNFRSVPGIVAWVNDFFGREIGAGEEGAQPSYTPLTPFRSNDPSLEGPPVVVLGGPHDKSVSVGNIREFEAEDVAAVVCQAIDEGWRVERDGQWQPLRLQDIAVLIPSRLSLPALEAAFSAVEVPFRPETSSLVYATQEVRDVLAGVRATVEPDNSIDVVAALRSSLFAIGDDDLLSWQLAGGSWDYRLRPASDDDNSSDDGGAGDDGAGDDGSDLLDRHPVAQAFAVLAGWHRDRWWTTPAAMIDRIVRSRRLREAALGESRPRDRWRRYRFLAEQAREFEATRGGDLTDFVAWVDVQASDLARVTEPVPAEPDDDAVRVLTVHGSKGLEFPMVILAGAPTQEKTRTGGPQVLFPAGSSPEVKVGKGAATAEFDLHASVEEVLDGYERVRLHYVAATRARDLLVVSAHHKERLASSGRRTWEGAEASPELWRGFERRGDERYEIQPPTQLRLTTDSYLDDDRIWASEQAAILEQAERVVAVSATGLAQRLARPGEADEPPLAEGAEPDAEQQPWRRGRAGTAVGSAVHAVLQRIDLDQPDAVEELADFCAHQEGVGELASEVAGLVRVALSAPAVELARANRHWRELYVSAPIGEALVEGFVDLCIDGADGLLVVDYKTDFVANEAEADRKLADYRIQGAVYALALEHITKRPVVECRFVFIGPAGVIERSITDLDEAKSDVVAHLAPDAVVTS